MSGWVCSVGLHGVIASLFEEVTCFSLCHICFGIYDCMVPVQSRGLMWRIEFDLKGAFAISILTLVVNKVSGFEVYGFFACACVSLPI